MTNKKRTQIGNAITIFRRGKKNIYTADFWFQGQHRRRSLGTSNLKVAKSRAIKLEAELGAGVLTQPDKGKPIVDATTDAVIPLITKYVFTGDPNARDKIIGGVGYYDEGAALDVADVIAQVDWFRAQDLVKGDADPRSMIDTRFLPTR